MANRNFNKQVAPARKKLAIGGPSSDTGKKGGMGLMGPRIKDMMKRPKDSPLKRGPKGEPVPRTERPLPLKPKDPRKMLPGRPMPKLPLKPKKPQLTPEQMERLKELFKKRRKKAKPSSTKREVSDKRKQLMGGGSSSSREAMMHGFYNKDMGMGKKKK